MERSRCRDSLREPTEDPWTDPHKDPCPVAMRVLCWGNLKRMFASHASLQTIIAKKQLRLANGVLVCTVFMDVANYHGSRSSMSGRQVSGINTKGNNIIHMDERKACLFVVYM